jgi:ubiquinone/menaquinone biosynthesis C-methylase UbiE
MSIEARLERQKAQADALAAQVRSWLAPLRGDERALDAGSGTGALALALAPLVREVVGVDPDEERTAAARELAPANARFEVADAAALPFPASSFDVVGCLRVLHHARRPELIVAELTRVLRPGGRLLLSDQIAPADPLSALELDRFERARDPSHTRLLPDGDVRAMLEMNDLVVRRAEILHEERPLEPYLDVAGATGEARERARELAPGEHAYRAEIGWYLAQKRAL